MPFDIIPKKEIKKTSWLTVGFYVSLVLLSATCLGFFILEYSLEQTEEKIIQVEAKIEQQESLGNKELEKELLKVQERINDFSAILENHKMNSGLFKFVEGITHPQISFSVFNFDSLSGQLTLSGTAQDFVSLGEQILIFYTDTSIKNLNITNMSLGGKEGIAFGVSITIDSQIFSLK